MLKFLSTQRRLAVFNVGIILFVSLLALVTPSVFKLMIEGVLPDGNWRAYWLGTAMLLCITFGRGIFGVIQDYVFLLHRQLIEVAALRAALQRPDLKTLNLEETYSTIRTFVGNFQYFWIQFSFYLAYAVFISAMVLLAFYWIEPIYCALAIVFMLFHLANFVVFRPRVESFASTFNADKSRMITEVASHLKLLPEARALGREAFFKQRMRTCADDYASAYQAKELTQIKQQWVQNGLIHGFYIVFFALALYLSMLRSVSIGSAALCLFLSGFLFEPIYRFSNIVKIFFEASAYSQWVPQSLQNQHSGPPQSGVLCLEQLQTQVMAKRHIPALNVTFAPGQLHLIKGPSGCGKSSLLDCIAGLEAPAAGQVLINGQVCQQRSVYYCEQNAAIFPGDLLQNLSFYNEAVYTPVLQRLLHLTQLSGLKQEHSRSLDSLSGGQKQRVAVARSLYCAYGVLLFDEPTSALDLENETAIFQLLQEAAKTQVVIMVSHSPRAEAFAGQVIDMGDVPAA